MRIFLTVLVIASLALGGCGRLRDSRLNPGNWFGKSDSRPVAQQTVTASDATANPLIPQQSGIFRRDKSEVYDGTPIDQIVALTVESIPTGAIIHVTGLSRLQGVHDVRLTSETDSDPVNGVLTYTLQGIQPQNQPQGTTKSRTFHVARYISHEDLARTTTIQVVGARNVRTTRR